MRCEDLIRILLTCPACKFHDCSRRFIEQFRMNGKHRIHYLLNCFFSTRIIIRRFRMFVEVGFICGSPIVSMMICMGMVMMVVPVDQCLKILAVVLEAEVEVVVVKHHY